MLDTILFDLDGTLIPMDQMDFVNSYVTHLCRRYVPCGYDKDTIVKALWAGTYAMVQNDGRESNEAAFWKRFTGIYGDRVLADKELFDAFYTNEFQAARQLCGSNPEAAAAVHTVKRLGLRAVLATNPIFPAVATESRIRWAGLVPEDFELYTTYENIGYCKPNPDYYREIARRLGVSPAECLMVGNDAQEDMAAEETGMQVFLLTDCLINKEGKDISRHRRGSFDRLMQLITEELRPCTP